MESLFSNFTTYFNKRKEKKHRRKMINKKLLAQVNQLDTQCQSLTHTIDQAYDRLTWLETFLRFNFPTAEMPASQGWRRIMHQAGGKMLELVDIICKDNNIPYWLYGGSLIGAQLYGKSISWDDDWDIGMMRADFERFREVCEKLLVNSDFEPAFIGISIQLRYKNAPVFGDVFPFDQYYKDLKTDQEIEKLEQKLLEAKDKMDWKLWHWEDALTNRSLKIVNEKDYQNTKKIYDEVIMNGRAAAKDGVLLENAVNPGKMVNGKKMYYTNLKNIFRYDWIFPLQRIEYEGVMVNAPHNIEALLGQKYGDILDLPANFETHQTKIQFKDLEVMQELIDTDMHKLYLKLKKNLNGNVG